MHSLVIHIRRLVRYVNSSVNFSEIACPKSCTIYLIEKILFKIFFKYQLSIALKADRATRNNVSILVEHFKINKF